MFFLSFAVVDQQNNAIEVSEGTMGIAIPEQQIEQPGETFQLQYDEQC